MKTILEHFKLINDLFIREYCLSHIDNRYVNDKCYTLVNALTFGVLCPTKDHEKHIFNYIKELL